MSIQASAFAVHTQFRLILVIDRALTWAGR